jgi:undecaprenyl-diphosphatase
MSNPRNTEAGDGPPATAAPKEAPHLPADPSSAGPLPAGVGASAPRASGMLVVGFAALVVCLVLLGTLAEAIRGNERFVLDATASPFLHAMASPLLDAVMNAATFLGSSFVIPPLFVVATVLLLVAKRPGSALFLAIASIGSLLLNELMKVYFHRPRPQLAWSHVQPDYSFPSGHTMNSVAFYVALAVIVWSLRGRRWGAIALVAAIALTTLIGVSRIYLGYHYLTDVVGGVLAGASWLLVVLAAFRTPFLSGYWPSRTRLRSQRPRAPARDG